MAKKPRFSGKRILLLQSLGFGGLLAIMWTAEALRLPHYFFGDPAEFNLTRVAARSIGLLVIWAIVHFTTARLLLRVHELEEFLLICSWCRKVGHNGDWLMLEEYFNSKFSTETSHGICPDCARQQLQQHRSALQCSAVAPAASAPPAADAAAAERA